MSSPSRREERGESSEHSTQKNEESLQGSQLQEIQKMLEEDRKQFLREFFAQREETAEARLIQILDGYQHPPVEIFEKTSSEMEEKLQQQMETLERRSKDVEEKLKTLQILDGRSSQMEEKLKTLGILDKRSKETGEKLKTLDRRSFEAEEKLKTLEMLDRKSKETEEKLKILDILDNKSSETKEKLNTLEKKSLGIEKKLKTVETLERRSLETEKKLQTIEEKLDKVLDYLVRNASQIPTSTPLPTSPPLFPPSTSPLSPPPAGDIGLFHSSGIASSSNNLIIYVWRTESTRSRCDEFKTFLQAYIDQNLGTSGLFQTRKSFMVKEVKSLEELKKDGILLLIGYTFSSFIEAEPVVAKKREITQSGFQGTIFFIVLRFGEKASPARLEDEKGQEVVIDFPNLNICYDSKGFILNNMTKASIKQIFNSV